PVRRAGGGKVWRHRDAEVVEPIPGARVSGKHLPASRHPLRCRDFETLVGLHLLWIVGNDDPVSGGCPLEELIGTVVGGADSAIRSWLYYGWRLRGIGIVRIQRDLRILLTPIRVHGAQPHVRCDFAVEARCILVGVWPAELRID